MATAKAAKTSPPNGNSSIAPKKVIGAADASRIARVAYMAAVLGKKVSEESLKQLGPEARKIANAINGQKTRDQAARDAAIKFREWAVQNAGPRVQVAPQSVPIETSPLGKKAS
jgi:hypothetical protein